MLLLLISASPLSISGCVTSAGNFCDVAAPITISRTDVLTDGTASQILKHDSYGTKACGWKSPKG